MGRNGGAELELLGEVLQRLGGVLGAAAGHSGADPVGAAGSWELGAVSSHLLHLRVSVFVEGEPRAGN